MMGRRSNLKGGAFERRQCLTLSLWASKSKRQDLYWRSATSGGRATVAAKRGHGLLVDAHAGDIVCTHKDGHFLLDVFQLECKHYASFELARTVYGKVGILGKLWTPTKERCEQTGRLPLVIAKEDMQQELILVCPLGLTLLQECAPSIIVNAYFPLLGCYVLLLREFLTKVSPDALRVIAARILEARRRR